MVSPAKVQVKPSADDRVGTAHLPELKRTASIFNALEDTIPKMIVSAKPRGLVALVTSTNSPLTASIMQHADLAPLLLYGTEDCVDAALEQLKAANITTAFKIRVYCRPQQLLPSDQRRLQERMACLVANQATVISQVPLAPADIPPPFAVQQ